MQGIQRVLNLLFDCDHPLDEQSSRHAHRTITRLTLGLTAVLLSSMETSVAQMPASTEAQVPDETEEEFGTLNPPDIGRETLRRKLEMGMLDPITCSLGFNTAKYDDHDLARRFALRCAETGITKAMTWMSHLEANGIGGEVNPVAAAEWDRRAAAAGDPVGMYNFGLDLLRGFGVARDEVLGRSYVDNAADLGLAIAEELRAANYDLDEVTPDADSW